MKKSQETYRIIYNFKTAHQPEGDIVWFKGEGIRKECGDHRYKVLEFSLVTHVCGKVISDGYLSVSLENVVTKDKHNYLTPHLELCHQEEVSNEIYEKIRKSNLVYLDNELIKERDPTSINVRTEGCLFSETEIVLYDECKGILVLKSK